MSCFGGFWGKSQGYAEILVLAVVIIILLFLGALGLSYKSDSEEHREHREHYIQVVADKYCGRNIGDLFAIDNPRRLERVLVLAERVDGGIAVEKVGGKFSRNRYEMIAECPGEVFDYKKDLN